MLDTCEWKQISELKVGEKVLFEGNSVTILDVIDNGLQETLEINMEDGKKHICTPEHRWFVYNNDTDECEWIQTEDICNGNYSMLEYKDE